MLRFSHPVTRALRNSHRGPRMGFRRVRLGSFAGRNFSSSGGALSASAPAAAATTEQEGSPQGRLTGKEDCTVFGSHGKQLHWKATPPPAAALRCSSRGVYTARHRPPRVAPFRGGPSVFEFSKAASEGLLPNTFVSPGAVPATTASTADPAAPGVPAAAAAAGAAARDEERRTSNTAYALSSQLIGRGVPLVGLYKRKLRVSAVNAGKQQEGEQQKQQQHQPRQPMHGNATRSSGVSLGVPSPKETNGRTADDAAAVEMLQATWRLMRRAAQQQRQVLPYRVAANISLLLKDTAAALQQAEEFAASKEPNQVVATSAPTATATAARIAAAATETTEAAGPNESLLRLCLNVLAFGATYLERQIKELGEAAPAAAAPAGAELCIEHLSLQPVLQQPRQQRNRGRSSSSSVGNISDRNSQAQPLYMPPALLLQTAAVVVGWLQQQQQSLAAGGSRLEVLQPTEAAAALRSLFLLLCHYAPLQHLRPAASAAAIPVFIHLLHQQHALQWPAALSTYRALLLSERAVRLQQPQEAFAAPGSTLRRGEQQQQQQKQRREQHQPASGQLPSVGPISSYWDGYGAQLGTPSLLELYAHLDCALLAFLSKRALIPVQEGGWTAQPQLWRERLPKEQQQQQQLAEGNEPGPVFSVAPLECAQLLLRPSACPAVRLAVGGELLQLLLLLQRDPSAYMQQLLLRRGEGEPLLLRETSALSTIAAAARSVLSWTGLAYQSTGRSSGGGSGSSGGSRSGSMAPQHQVELSCLRRDLLQAARGGLLSLLLSSSYRRAVTLPSDGMYGQYQQQQERLLLHRLQALAALSEVYAHPEVFTTPIASALLWEALMLLRIFAREETKTAGPRPAAAAGAVAGPTAADRQRLTPVLTPLLKLADRLSCVPSLSGGQWPMTAAAPTAATAAGAGIAYGEPALLQQATRFFGGSPVFLVELLREIAVQQQEWLVKEVSLWGALPQLQQQQQQQQQQQAQQPHRKHQQTLQPLSLLHAPKQLSAVVAGIGCITSSLLKAIWGYEGGAAALVYLQLQRAHSCLSALHADPAFLPSLLSMRLHWQQQQQQHQQQHIADTRHGCLTDAWTLMSRTDYAFGLWLKRQQQQALLHSMHEQQHHTFAAAATFWHHSAPNISHDTSTVGVHQRQQQQVTHPDQLRLQHQLAAARSGCGWEEQSSSSNSCSRSYTISPDSMLWESSLLQESATLLASATPLAALAWHSLGTQQQVQPQEQQQPKHQQQELQQRQELVLPLGTVLRAVKKQIAQHSAALHAEAPFLQVQRQTDEQLMQLLQQHLQQLQHQLQRMRQQQIGAGVLADTIPYTHREQQQRKLQLEPTATAAALRIQRLMHECACADISPPQAPEELLSLLQDVYCMLQSAQTGLEQRIAAGACSTPERPSATAVEALTAAAASTTAASLGAAGSLPTSTQSCVGQPAESARIAASGSGNTNSLSNNDSLSTVIPLGMQIRIGCCVIAGPPADPPVELLQLLALFVSPLWLLRVLPGLAGVAALLHSCSPIRDSNAQHFSHLQQRVNLMLQLRKLHQQQQRLSQALKRVLQLQQRRITQQHAVVSSLRAAAEQRHLQQRQQQLPGEQHFRTKQQERQQARWERLVQRRVQQQEVEAESNKNRLVVLSSASAALAFSHEHFKQSVVRQLLLPQLLQQDRLLRRIEKLLQRCRRLNFLRRQMKKTSSSSNSSIGQEVPFQRQEQQQDEHQEPLRGEVMTSLAFAIDELHAVLGDALEHRRLDMQHSVALEKLHAVKEQQQQHQRRRGDAFADWAHTALCSCSSSLLQAAADLKRPPSVKWIIHTWRALLIEDALRVSQRQSRQQEKQREELQQQLFAALALRIRNQTAAGQQPLDVAELLSADCPLPPRVSAALFSLLYRHSLPLLLHPQQQLLLLFSAFRAEQEQHWCGTAAQAGAALAGMAPGVLQGYLADIWKIRQKTAEAQDQWASFRLLACCLARRRVDERLLSLLLPHVERFASGDPIAAEEAGTATTVALRTGSTTMGGSPWPAEWLQQGEELPSVFAYTSQVAVFAAAAVAAVPSPLLPQEVTDLWQQHRQKLVQERLDGTGAAPAAPKRGLSHTFSTAELQQRIGSVLQQINASLLLQQDTWCRLRRVLHHEAQQQQRLQQQLGVVRQKDSATASHAAADSLHHQAFAAAESLPTGVVQQQTAGKLHLLQPSLHVLQQCSRLALAFCSWGQFECLALPLLLQVAAAAVHALRPLAPVWLQQQQQALQHAAALENLHPPLLVLQQQQLSRARAAIEEATGDLGITVSLLQCLCPQILRGLMHATDLQRLLNDCDALLDAAAAARRHIPLSHPSAAATEKVAEVDSVRGVAAHPTRAASGAAKANDAGAAAGANSLGIDAKTAFSGAADALEYCTPTAAETTEATGAVEELHDAATAKPSTKGGWDWHLLETEVASILRELIPAAEGSPAKAAHLRVCGLACTRTQHHDVEPSPLQQLLQPLQLQRQGKPLLLAFIFPADTWGRRQGILLPKKLLQLFLLRRLGWEVRLVNLSDCRDKSPLELQRLLVAELNAGRTQTSLWSLHPLQGEGVSTERLSEAEDWPS